MRLQVAWVALSVSLVLVAGRTWTAARSAIRPALQASNSGAPRRPGDPGPELDRRDSLLAAATLPARNPFAAPRPVIAPRGPTRPAPPVEEPPPRVVLLMDDGTSKLVQLEVGGETSARMTVGSAFKGWVIQGVSEGGIAVSKNGRRLVLPRP